MGPRNCCDHPALVPEERLLLAIARSDPSAEDLEHALSAVQDPRFSWQKTLELAETQRVQALLAKSVQENQVFYRWLPDEISRVLGVAKLEAQFRQELYIQSLSPPFAALASEGIPLVLLKGAALIETLYPPSTRLLNDVDVLIRKEDYTSVAGALEKSGFKKWFKHGQSEQSLLRHYHEINFVKPWRQAMLGVDLHWQIYPPNRPFLFDTHSLIARARPVQFGEAPVFALSPEDSLVHYGTQLVYDSLETSCQRLVDICVLVRSGLCWKLLCEIAQDTGATGTTYLALGVAKMFGIHIPPWVLRRLKDSCPGCGVATEVLADPRWPFQRWKIRYAARHVLMPLLYGQKRHRLAGFISLPLQDFQIARNNGAGCARASLRTVRTIASTIFCGSALWAIAMGMGLAHGHSVVQGFRHCLWKHCENSPRSEIG